MIYIPDFKYPKINVTNSTLPTILNFKVVFGVDRLASCLRQLLSWGRFRMSLHCMK